MTPVQTTMVAMTRVAAAINLNDGDECDPTQTHFVLFATFSMRPCLGLLNTHDSP